MRENFQIPIPSSFDHDNAHSLNADGSAIAIVDNGNVAVKTSMEATFTIFRLEKSMIYS